MSKRNYEINMTEGSLWGKILYFACPLMLTNILQLLYNAADNVVVGRYAADGEAALAAVSSTSSLINLIVNLFIGLSVGTSVVVANYRGAGKSRDVQEAVHTSVAISLVFGMILLCIGVLFSKTFLRLMDSPDDVIDLAALYMKIYFVGMPFNMAYNFGAAVLRAVGDTKRPLYILTFSGALNVVLNLVFVIAFGMDVAGVALATIISQAVSAVLVLLCLMRSDGDIHLSVKKLRIDKGKLWELTKCGLPAGLQGMLFSISNVLIQSTVNSYGKAVMAGNGVSQNIEGFINALTNTIYQSALTFTGQNFGAKKYKRMRSVLLICVLYTGVLGLASGLLVLGFGEPLMAIFRPDKEPEVIEAGLLRMRILCTTYWICAIMDAVCGCLRGMGKTIQPMIVSLLSVCVFRVIWILTVYRLNPVREMLYVTYPISWILASAAHTIMYAREYKKITAVRE